MAIRIHQHREVICTEDDVSQRDQEPCMCGDPECKNCFPEDFFDDDYDPTPDEEGEPPITIQERRNAALIAPENGR